MFEHDGLPQLLLLLRGLLATAIDAP